MSSVDPYIRLHHSLRDHPKINTAMRLLKSKTRPLLIGALVELWWWASLYAPNGDLTEVSDQQIADAAEWPGDPSHFVQALIHAKGPSGHGFIDLVNGRKTLHDWDDYLGLLNDLKARNREYQARYRAHMKEDAQHRDNIKNGKTDSKIVSDSTNLTTSDSQTYDSDLAHDRHDSHARHGTELYVTIPELNRTKPERNVHDSHDMPIAGPRPPGMSVSEYVRRSKILPTTGNETPPISAAPPTSEDDPAVQAGLRAIAARQHGGTPSFTIGPTVDVIERELEGLADRLGLGQPVLPQVDPAVIAGDAPKIRSILSAKPKRGRPPKEKT